MRTITKGVLMVMGLGMWALSHAATDWSTQDYDLYAGDFNYDGKSDLLYVAKSPDKLSGIALSDASGGPNTPYQSWPSNYLGIDWSGNKYSPIIADFNCDGRSDVLMQSSIPNGISYLLFANVQGELTGINQSIAHNALGITWTSDQHKIIPGHFDGGCRAGLFFQAVYSSGTHYVVYPDSYGTFTANATQSWTDTYNNLGLNWSVQKANVFAGDFNGDYKDDLLVQAKPQFVMIDYDVTFPVPTYAANMNGVALSQGGTTPFVLSRVQTWSRMNNGVDWSPLTNNLVVGDFNGDGRDDVILQAKHTGQTSYMLAGNPSGNIFPATPAQMGSGANWSAGSYKLIAGNFDGTGGVGIYFQALTSSGLNSFANTVTGSSVTTTPQNSSQVTGAVPATSPGRTVGAFNVSSTGAATYNIPIWVPPGPNGMQPSLALAYNSQSGAGSVGPGWALSGLTAIRRCNKTFAQDGAPGAIALNVNDAYCLNGNRLLKTGGTYGAEGSTYQTEISDFSKVVAHTISGVQNGPAWFEVWGKDGLIYEYGNVGTGSNGSRVMATGTSTATEWLLNKVKDRAGNNYIVTYGTGASGSAGIGVPLSVAYTPISAGSSTYKYTVTFTYPTDPSERGTEVGYVAGTLVKNTNLLTVITVKSGSTLLRKYNLGYQVAPTTARARLSTVQECAGSLGTDCLTPTTITYSDGIAGVGATTATPAPNSPNLQSVCDVNGDNRDDVVYGYNGWVYAMMANSAAPGFKTPIGVAALVSAVHCEDLGGTGQDDLVWVASGVLKRYRWNGTGFDVSDVGTASGVISAPVSTFRLADVNGDGLPDLLTSSSIGLNDIYVRLNTTSPGGVLTFSTTNTLAYTDPNPPSSMSGSSWVSKSYTTSSLTSRGQFDFNGDGRQDVVFRVWYWVVNYGTKDDYYVLLSGASGFTAVGPYTQGYVSDAVTSFSVANFNDDECSDAVYTINDTSLSHVSACNGSPAVQGWLDRHVASLDWDGDGRSDHLLANGATSNVLLSTGGGNSAVVATSVPALGVSSGLLFPLDIDGDGLDDLGIKPYGSGNSITYALHNAAGTPPDLVKSITDGYGVTIQPSYTSTAQGNYTKSTGLASGAYKELDRPMIVVSQVTQPDGVGGTYTSTYSYTGAVQSLQRGFAGFQSIAVSDNRADSPVVKTYYRTDFPYTGMVSQQDIYQHNGSTLMSRTVNTLLVNSSNGTYFPYVKNTTIETREVGGTKNGQIITKASRDFTYDGYGNATTITTTVTDKDSGSQTYDKSWTTAVTTTLTPNTQYWCLGLQTQVQAAYSSTVPNEAAVTRTVGFVPNYDKCRIDSKNVEPASGSYGVTYGYLYDAFGNVSTETVQGIGMAARTTTIGWGATGQFPVTVMNPANETTTYGYDDRFGLQNSVTDPNNVSTTPTAFDNFGRTLLEYRADGTSTAYGYYNCSSIGCQNGDPVSAATGINKMVVIATSKDTTGAAIKDDWTYLDQFDRTIVTRSKVLNGSYSRVGTQYDSLGRAWRQTVPCDSTACVAYWITNTYDARGRVTRQERPIKANNLALQATLVSYQGMTTVTTDAEGKNATKVVDPNGRLRRSQDHDGYYQDFGYDAFGSVLAVNDSLGTPLFRAAYAYGIGAFQTRVNDADLGKVNLADLNQLAWTYTPNALGEVVAYTDANGNTVTTSYDVLSRPLTQSVTGETTRRWIWGNSAASRNIGRLHKVCLSSAVDCSGATQLETSSYDSYGRLQQKDVVADGTYTYNYAYNNQGLLDTLTYPTSTGSYRLALKHLYQNGALRQVKDANASTVFWQANAANPRGQITQETLGNQIITNRSFDPITGWVNSIQSGLNGGTGVQNESYLFDKAGNVTQRQNNTLGLTEDFYYDNLYRLDYSKLNGATNLDVMYDAMGRITKRTDVASNAAWTYHATKLHAVTQAGSSAYTYTYDNNGNAITRNGQSITWNKYNYPTVINGSATEKVTLSYDANNQRWKQVYVNGSTTETTYYIDGLMEKVTTGSVTDYRYYIYASGRAAVATMSCSTLTSCTTGNANVANTRYVLEDHQDSIAKLTNNTGGVIVSESFSAFGNRRNPSTWSGAPSASDLSTLSGITRQGYTWQTALGSMGLNHMNGRVQDAIIGRFLSADPYISYPENTQNYNRYSYVSNNPMRWIDPSGFIEEVVVTCCSRSPSPTEYWGYRATEGPAIYRPALSGATAAETIRTGIEPLKDVLEDNAQSQKSDTCNQTLVNLGNKAAGLADSVGDVSGKLVLAGLATTLAGIVTVQPEVAAVGVAVTATGGVSGIGAGLLQIGGGVLQGLGGAGYSNAINGLATLGTSAVLGRFISGPSSSGYRTVSQRASDRFLSNAATTTGGVFDTAISLLQGLGPQQKQCN